MNNEKLQAIKEAEHEALLLRRSTPRHAVLVSLGIETLGVALSERCYNFKKTSGSCEAWGELLEIMDAIQDLRNTPKSK